MLNIERYFGLQLDPIGESSDGKEALFVDRSPESPIIRIDGGKQEFTVVRLGPREAWIELSGASIDVNRPLEVSIRAGNLSVGPIRATIVPLPRDFRGRPWLALRLAANRSACIEIANLLAHLTSSGIASLEDDSQVEERETIDDPTRVAAITTALLRGGRPAVALDGANVRSCWGQAEGASHIGWRTEGAPIDATGLVVEAEGYASKYRLIFDEGQREGERFVTGRPARIERVRRRRQRRAAPASSLVVTFAAPLFLDHPTDHEVIDLSHDGVSFCVTEADALFPGLTIDPLIIAGADQAPLIFRARVRSMRQRADGTTVVGVALEGASPETEARWIPFVSRELGPATQIGNSWEGTEWDVFVRSGYFGLSGKTPEDFDRLRTALTRTSRRLSEAPQLSCQSVWRSERGAEATCWTLRAYQDTWLGHQLAKLPGKDRPAQILREMYLHIWETAAASRARWLLCYQEAHIKWVQRVHIDFARPYEASGRAAVLTFRLTETDTESSADTTETDLTVDLATSSERSALWEHIARTRPRPYVEALDFVPERAELTDLAASWQQVGLERSRTIYVARVEGRAIAAAVVETAEEGTNLFRILDGVRMFELEPGGNRAFPTLIDAARAHYRQRGKPSFVCYLEEEQPWLMEAARLRDLGEGYIWIVAGDLIPDFLEHTCQYTWARDGGLRKERSN